MIDIDKMTPLRIIAILIAMVAFAGKICSSACTSAIIGADASANGRPLLWKLRDTSTIDNKVEYIPAADGAYAYVALFNANDKKLEQAWIGMNSEGFAVMNTASYNLKDDKVPQNKMDREGFIMTIALRSCRTVDDFEKLLLTLPRPMGVEANFGAIDALGNGAYFETNNHSFTRYDIQNAPDNVLIRTNYSHSGRQDEGYGFIREANAKKLLAPYIAQHNITPEVLTEVVSRSFYHDLYGHDMATSGEKWLIDQDFIPRYKSTATIVIEGIRPLADLDQLPDDASLTDQYIMWTGIGYPPCSEILPVWCTPNGVPEILRGIGPDGHSPLGDEVKKRRDDVFSFRKGNRDKYINVEKLFNARGTGYVQQLTRLNHQTYLRIRANRKAPR